MQRFIFSFLKWTTLLFSFLFLSGCTSAVLIAIHNNHKYGMKGMSEKQVRACLGKPNRVAHMGDQTVWTYVRKEPRSPHTQEQPTCIVHVTYKNGFVKSVRYNQHSNLGAMITGNCKITRKLCKYKKPNHKYQMH